jgi:integrase
MAKPFGLVQRGGWWTIRIRVPVELVSAIGKREVGHSLRTQDRREAEQRFRSECVRYDQMFADARRGVQPVAQMPADLTPVLPPVELRMEEVQRLALLWFNDHELKTAREDTLLLQARNANELEAIALNRRMDEAPLLAELSGTGSVEVSPFTQARLETERLLNLHGLKADWSEAPTKSLHTLVARGLLESLNRSYLRLAGSAGFATLGTLPSGNTTTSVTIALPAVPAKPKPMLSKLLDNYIRERRPTKGTELLYRRCAGWLIGVCGNLPIDQYTREHLLTFREALEKSPSQASRKRRGPLKSQKNSKQPPRSTKSVINTLSAVNTIFKYALSRDLIQSIPTQNLFPKNKGEPIKRLSFDADDLNAMFHAPLYTGCEDDGHGYAKPGPAHPKGCRFWVPLIALYSGMRLNEICQLLTEDIETHEDIACFMIRREDAQGRLVPEKRLKTKNARRTVPVHPELLELGFMGYLAEQRTARCIRLFHEIPMTSVGTYSDSFQKWFRRFQATVGINEHRKTFHSFRHTFRDALRAADVPLEKVNALCGWAESAGLAAHYGNGYPVSSLHEAISRVAYPGLDFTHLRTVPERCASGD